MVIQATVITVWGIAGYGLTNLRRGHVAHCTWQNFLISMTYVILLGMCNADCRKSYCPSLNIAISSYVILCTLSSYPYSHWYCCDIQRRLVNIFAQYLLTFSVGHDYLPSLFWQVLGWISIHVPCRKVMKALLSLCSAWVMREENSSFLWLLRVHWLAAPLIQRMCSLLTLVKASLSGLEKGLLKPKKRMPCHMLM